MTSPRANDATKQLGETSKGWPSDGAVKIGGFYATAKLLAMLGHEPRNGQFRFTAYHSTCRDVLFPGGQEQGIIATGTRLVVENSCDRS